MKTSMLLRRFRHLTKLAALTVWTLAFLATGMMAQNPRPPEPGPGGPPRDPKPPGGERFAVTPITLDPSSPTTVRSFRINDGAESATNPEVYVIFNFTGAPTHYRVSNNPNFSGVNWQPLNVNGPPPKYDFNPIRTPGVDVQRPVGGGSTTLRPNPTRYGERTLYLQLKGEYQPGQGNLTLPKAESLSAVTSDSIVLMPARTKRYTFSASEIKAVLEYAKQQGFTFTNSLASSTLSSPKCFPSPFQDGFSLDTEGIRFSIPGMKILVAEANPGETRTIDGTFFGGRSLNRFWNIISDDLRLERGDGWDLPEAVPSQSSISISRAPSNNDPSFAVRFKFTARTRPQGCTRWFMMYPAIPIPVGDDGCACIGTSIRLAKLTLEGPEEDNWVDANNKWKNAFFR